MENEKLNKKINDVISYETQRNLFANMKDKNLSNLERKKIRNKLIEDNIGLVLLISEKYSAIYKIDVDELNSYGYEGLIHAVDTFDETLGKIFSIYALYWIRSFISRGTSYVLGFRHQNNLFYMYWEVKNEVEMQYEQKLLENPNLVYIIVDKMIKRFNISKETANHLLNNLFINTLGICEIEDISNPVENEAFNNDLILQTDNVLNSLEEQEKEVLKLRYGFEDRSVSLRELATQFGVSFQNIHRIEKATLKKIKNSSRIERIKDYY